jgi:pimeloyl-ACP methyl ester carboxylesterase
MQNIPLVTSDPFLVFIPGFLMPGIIWEKQLAYFGDHYLSVAIDPRSQGKSSKVSYGHYTERRAKDIGAVVDRLGRPKLILVGWSLAVAEVLSYAEQFQDEMLLGLVLVDETLNYEVREDNAWNSIQSSEPGPKKLRPTKWYGRPSSFAECIGSPLVARTSTRSSSRHSQSPRTRSSRCWWGALVLTLPWKTLGVPA